jgi:hypothetical protein
LKKNPSGLEESQKSRAAANMARRARNPEDTSPGLANNLFTVPKSSAGGEKEDLEESESGMAEMAEKHDGSGDDASLASGGEKAAFSSFMMSSETTVPPCHQKMENSDMECLWMKTMMMKPRRLLQARSATGICGIIK